MELLFKDDTGNVEIKELLGFLDVAIPYKNLKAKIKTATNDVIALIGKATYDLAVTEYKKEAEKNEDLIFAVRYPIAIQAYRKYAPHNDVAHTSEGRLNRLEDNQKSAFQWQVDNDNDALEKSYYEALDDLIIYLDDNIDSWKETDQYKKTKSLFIANSTEFDDIFPIGNSRLLFLKLAPGIRLCENNEIVARVGKELFTSLKADPSTDTEIVQKIKEACVYSSLAWAMRRMSVKLFPEGVLQGFKSERLHGKSQKPAENNEAYAVAYYFEIDKKKVLLELEQLIYEKNKPADEEIQPIKFNADPNQKFINL